MRLILKMMKIHQRQITYYVGSLMLLLRALDTVADRLPPANFSKCFSLKQTWSRWRSCVQTVFSSWRRSWSPSLWVSFNISLRPPASSSLLGQLLLEFLQSCGCSCWSLTPSMILTICHFAFTFLIYNYKFNYYISHYLIKSTSKSLKIDQMH